MSQSPASSPSSTSPDAVARLRLQAAVIRTLLDQIDERTSLGVHPGLVEQVVEELQRLSTEAHRAAAAIVTPADPHPHLRASLAR